MPVGIGYEGGQSRIPEQNRAVQTDRAEPTRRREEARELESSSTANEQRARDRAAQNNGLLATPEQTVVRPSQETVAQLQANEQSQNLSNASGLGQTATRSYRSLENTEFNENIRRDVRVDISV